MTHTIELDEQTEQALTKKANRLGLSADDLLKQLALEATAEDQPDASSIPRTGAELIAALEKEGLLTGYGDSSIDSPELARRLRDAAQWRHLTRSTSETLQT